MFGSESILPFWRNILSFRPPGATTSPNTAAPRSWRQVAESGSWPWGGGERAQRRAWGVGRQKEFGETVGPMMTHGLDGG